MKNENLERDAFCVLKVTKNYKCLMLLYNPNPGI